MLPVERISPEGIRVAEAYLKCGQSVTETANYMNLPVEVVEELLNKRETKAYIDRLYYESGFRNRERMGQLMDAIISRKLEEMEESGLGSGKDIIEILSLAHKMKMDQMQMELKLLEAQNKTPAVQINTQINNAGGDKYNQLLERILEAKI